MQFSKTALGKFVSRESMNQLPAWAIPIRYDIGIDDETGCCACGADMKQGDQVFEDAELPGFIYCSEACVMLHVEKVN